MSAGGEVTGQDPAATAGGAAPAGSWDTIGSPPGAPASPRDAFRVGSFLGASFSTWARNALPFASIGVACAVPSAVVGWLTYRSMSLPTVDPTAPFAHLLDGWWRGFTVMGANALASSLASAAVVHGAVQHLRGAPVSAAELLAAGVRRYPSTLAVTLLASLAFLGTGCTVVIPAILGAGWCAALPAAVVERRGPLDAMGRSWRLTRGLRWRIFGGFIVLMLVTWAVVVPAQLVVKAALGAGPYGERLALAQVVGALLAGITSSLVAAGTAVAYHQLREAVEGTDAAQLGKVFE